jgi:hypothetical protein
MCKYKETETWVNVFDAALKEWVCFMQRGIVLYKSDGRRLVERIKPASYPAP